MKPLYLTFVLLTTGVQTLSALPYPAEYADQTYIDTWNSNGGNPTILWFDMAVARRQTKYHDDNLLSTGSAFYYSFEREWDELTSPPPNPSYWYGSPQPDQDTKDSMEYCHDSTFWSYHWGTEEDKIWRESWSVASSGHYTSTERYGFWRGVGHSTAYGAVSGYPVGASGDVGVFYKTWATGDQYTGSGDTEYDTVPLVWDYSSSTWSIPNFGSQIAPSPCSGNVRILDWAHE